MLQGDETPTFALHSYCTKVYVYQPPYPKFETQIMQLYRYLARGTWNNFHVFMQSDKYAAKSWLWMCSYSMFPIKRTVFFSTVTVGKNMVRLIGIWGRKTIQGRKLYEVIR